MFERGGTNESPDPGETTEHERTDELAAAVPAAESVCYRLAARKRVVRETDAGREPLAPPTDGEWAVVLTDRAVHVVRSDAVEETIDYRDVRSVEASTGLVRSRLAIRVWNRGTVPVAVQRGEPVEAGADFLERASETHQRVIAALESAREHVTDLGSCIEAGDRGGTRAAHEAIDEQLSLARRRIDAGPDRTAAALEGRVATVSTELHRTRTRAHVARAKTLVEVGNRRTDAEDWDAALTAYRRARDHLETARDAATAQGFDVLGAIETELERVDEHVDRLASLPLRLARDAHETARNATDLEAAVPAWAAALEHYRAALTAGWGTPVDFGGDADDVSARVERTATELIDARCALADRLRREGDDSRMAGGHAAAADRYRAALDQLAAANRVARELRAGEPDAIDKQRRHVRERLAAALRAIDDGDDAEDDDAGDAATGRPDGDAGPNVDILAHKP